MNQLLIGQIGCGRWGRYILRDLKSLGCRVAVVTTSAEGIANAREHKADFIVENISGLCEHRDMRGAVVATPTATHHSVMRQLIEARPDLSIFTEKPATASKADALDLLRMKPQGIFVMDKWRYHPGILKLAEIARNRSLGVVVGIKTERLGWGKPHQDLNSGWHLLPHDLSIVDEILGYLPALRFSQQQIVDGFCMGANIILGEDPWVSCVVSSHSPLRIRRVQLICKDGVAVLDGAYANSIQVASGPLDAGDRTPSIEEIQLEDTMPLLTELEVFVRFLDGTGGPPKAPLHESHKIVELIENALTGSTPP